MLMPPNFVRAMVLKRPWTTQQWCASVTSPNWPFAYQKAKSQQLEWKGRTNSNLQDVRHQCTVFGVQSKCHRCEDFRCGTTKSATCAYQIQGVDWNELPQNIPTVTDVPWGVNGKHRYDYTGASHVCLFTSGGSCLSPFASDFSKCAVRCWGTNSGAIASSLHPLRGNTSLLPRGDADASDIWSYSKSFSASGTPQGMVSTLAGAGTKGWRDGTTASALFNNPQDVAVDSKGFVYVADTDNHRIRKIDPTLKTVSTIAGDGTIGFTDGVALTARFSFPTGIAVFEDAITGQVTLYIADTGNHRIRKLQSGVVSCIAGLCGKGVESVIQGNSPAAPHPGLADGDPNSSRFDSPMGIAVDHNGIVFVADTGNHLIRRIELDGTTNTLAGNVAPSDPIPGCLPPCLHGVAGTRDGNLTYARFNSPRDVAIGPSQTIVVADGHRVRRINYDGTTSTLESITSKNRVVTLAGSLTMGNVDGVGDEATMNFPAGVTVAADGRVYTVSPITCKIRQISTASLVARPMTCTSRVSDVLAPSGCSSYEPEVDELFDRGSPLINNIYYNFENRSISDSLQGLTLPGRQIKDCTGTPPVDVLLTGDRCLALRDASGQVITNIKEDQEDGTTIQVKCPTGCATASGKVYGTTWYTDASSICMAAIHAGVTTSASGGLITVTLRRGIGFYNTALSKGTTANGIASLDMPSAEESARLFSLALTPTGAVQVETVAGQPSALLKSGCGFRDGMPALSAKFKGPMGIETYYGTSLSRSNLLFIADSGNHAIRQMTATCSKICENGGTCVAPDSCGCLSGWTGDDCSIPVCSAGKCGTRQVCVGPELCACIPGYTGTGCNTALCVQQCQNGGTCTAPDTCTCATGWFDSNCTTPVCTQTCGNGGNCTAPSTCSCPDEWQGVDCRVPVCHQVCQNGGSCVAPNTCQCPAGWSGHDCSIPVCSQGFFVAHPSGYTFGLSRPFHWAQYVPCDWTQWCLTTNEFDCLARAPISPFAQVPFGANGRAATGRIDDPGLTNCMFIELGEEALTHFQYAIETGATSGFFRYSPKTPFGWNASTASAGPSPWRGIAGATVGFLPPFTLTSDRQVAWVEKRNVVQGVYACANGGSCVAPGICECAAGWIGFDCRVPVCEQGYYNSSQQTFLAADPPESADPAQPVSNPVYQITKETIGYSELTVETVTLGNVRYLLQGGTPQGGYACSIRSITKWEKPATSGPFGSPEFYFRHPNYFSLYMDSVTSADGHVHTHWFNMSWPPLYNLTPPLLDQTRQGWRRGGIWELINGSHWQKGKCLLEYERVCDGSQAPLDLLTGNWSVLVTDTDRSYRPRVVYSYINATRRGFWNQTLTGQCVDQVRHGCFNNGTCVAPNTCSCANGWTGADCSIPICQQKCLHNGNCTLPNRCTCEIGWTGNDCSIAMCAQDCRNQGKCVAPDTCLCRTWPSTWRDGRENGGQPVFRYPNGSAQHTGWTGYDCNTPICVQAETFVLNTLRSDAHFVSLRGHGQDGQLACNTHRCPQYDQEVITNDGRSFQSGCMLGNPWPNPKSVYTSVRKIQNIRDYNDSLNVGRASDDFLCGNLVWEQGDYTQGRTLRVNYNNITKVDDDTWVQSNAIAGEGVFMCYHKGSCIAPDVCTCGDGYTGIDCRKPLCRFLQDNGKYTGCQNKGVCVDKDTCRCLQIESTLHQIHPTAPRGLTGYFGSDCSIPICIQGVFDPLCKEKNAGVDGCYRCQNGGLCVRPDVCECAKGWTGFDCSIPVCDIPDKELTASVRQQLFTVDENKVLKFQSDPCGTDGGRWGKELVNGAMIGQGNCTAPRRCTCLCRKKYDPVACKATGDFCDKPWHDPFNRSLAPGFVYGSKLCVDGFQGLEDEYGRFMSCHLQIYVPSLWRRYTVSVVAILSVLSFFAIILYYYLKKKIRRQLLLAKAERRRSRKASGQMSQIQSPKKQPGAFQHPKTKTD